MSVWVGVFVCVWVFWSEYVYVYLCAETNMSVRPFVDECVTGRLDVFVCRDWRTSVKVFVCLLSCVLPCRSTRVSELSGRLNVCVYRKNVFTRVFRENA